VNAKGLFQNIVKRWQLKVWSRLSEGVRAIAIASLIVSGSLLGLRVLGALQFLELRAYDQMTRLRPQQQTDNRLLVVTINDMDLKQQGQSSLSDQIYAEVLANLEQHNPVAIGLDIYRDVPQEPGHDVLHRQLQSPKVIGITKLGNTEETTIPPPPGMTDEQIGFNDLVVDRDGVVRRNLLFSKPEREERNLYSFSLRLALKYLAEQDPQILPQASPKNPDYLQLGNEVFKLLTPTSGGYQNLDNSGSQILLNYRSDHNSRRSAVQQISLSEVLQNSAPLESLVEGRIILIGNVAESGKDLFHTPYTAEKANDGIARGSSENDHQMPGVIIHAQMVSQFLDAATGHRPLISFWSDGAEGLWIILWAIAGGTLGWSVRNTIKLSLGGITLFTLLGGSSAGLFIMGYVWVPVVTPALATVFTSGLLVAYRAQRADCQEKMMISLLGQNTSPEIADALWKNRGRLVKSGQLPGQQVIATMLFTDLKNFSTVAEQMPPERLLDWLNEYLSIMTQEVQTFHGIINKFTGDGLLAVFGVPMAHEHPSEISKDAQNAVSCAVGMGCRLNELNQDWKKRGLPTVAMRIGIFTGRIVVGSLGGKEFQEYGVIGDSVNIAAYLESCKKESQENLCRILIAQETLDHLDGEFEVVHWGPMALKGRQEKVNVYQVTGYKKGASIGRAPSQVGSRMNSSTILGQAP